DVTAGLERVELPAEGKVAPSSELEIASGFVARGGQVEACYEVGVVFVARRVRQPRRESAWSPCDDDVEEGALEIARFQGEPVDRAQDGMGRIVVQLVEAVEHDEWWKLAVDNTIIGGEKTSQFEVARILDTRQLVEYDVAIEGHQVGFG